MGGRDSSPRAPAPRNRRRLLVAAVVVLVAGGGTALAMGVFNTRRVIEIVRVSPIGSRRNRATDGSTHPPARPGPPAPAGPSAASVLSPNAAGSFEQLQAGLPGPVEVAVQPLGQGGIAMFGPDSPAHGWSTTKVPVLVALLRARGGAGLTAAEAQQARLAITASDNQSILGLFSDLETMKGGLAAASEFVQQLFRESGDAITTVATGPPPPGAVTTFGQTEWAPSVAVKFFRSLARGCLLPTADTRYVLGLMENVEPSESWGLGSAGFDRPVAFKGGWGPEASGAYLVRQSGIVAPRSPTGVAVSIVAHPPPGNGSFATGAEMVTSVAKWLHRELVVRPRPVAPCSNS